MDPINVLMNEHRVIEQVLNSLSEVMLGLAEQGQTDRARLGRFVTFLREFADAVHHSKEEDILFEKMTEHGFSRASGPLAVMLSDHETSRGYVRILWDASERGALPWTTGEAESVVQAATNYTNLLRAHIHREDNILYSMARNHIPSDEMYLMGKRFAEMAAEAESNGTKQRLYSLAAELTGQTINS